MSHPIDTGNVKGIRDPLDNGDTRDTTETAGPRDTANTSMLQTSEGDNGMEAQAKENGNGQYDGFTNVVINVERVRILDPSEQNVLAIGKKSGNKYPIIYIPKPDNGDTSSEFFRLHYQPDNNEAPATVLVNLKTSLPVGVDDNVLYADIPSFDIKIEDKYYSAVSYWVGSYYDVVADPSKSFDNFMFKEDGETSSFYLYPYDLSSSGDGAVGKDTDGQAVINKTPLKFEYLDLKPSTL